MKKILVLAAFLVACSPAPVEPAQPAPQASFYTDPPQVGFTPVVQVYDSSADTSVHKPDNGLDVMIFTAPNGCQWLVMQGYQAGAMVEYKGPDHQQICVPRNE